MQEKLRHWFRKNKRSLIFRQAKSPYSVWISEVMLQQTRVEAVLPYFSSWMERFPDISTLAKSPKADVIKQWEGLGYYSRARNIHKGAQQIINNYQGFIPDRLEDLLQIQGIGPYTARAILSFGFQKSAAPVDGNVIRVLTRLYAINDFIEIASTKKQIQELADSMLPDHKPYEIAEGFIELGSVICKKEKPRCLLCPLKQNCKAYANNKVHFYPKKKKAQKPQFLEKSALIFMYEDQFLITKHQKGLMQDLHEFPTLDGRHSAQTVLKRFGIKGHFVKEIEKITAFFTKYKLHLYGFVFQIDEPLVLENFTFVSKDQIRRLPFSSGHRKILKHL